MTEQDDGDLAAEVADLKDRVADLEERLEKQADGGGSGSATASEARPGGFGRWGDVRDHKVLDALVPSETYSANDIRTAYRKQTDITKNSTLKARMIALVESDMFERAGHSRWKFVGEDDYE